MTHLVQLQRGRERRVALVEGPDLRLLRPELSSVHALVLGCEGGAAGASKFAAGRVTAETLAYEPIYRGESEWRLLAPIDHPEEAARCLVSGTGLTHFGSAQNRAAMHAGAADHLTDSMRMFRLGEEAGRPAPGAVGAAPEWFYKGTGAILRPHGAALDIPEFAEDGGEEAEVAGLYVIGRDGCPIRVGLANANEFSDHVFERKNYLNLAGSKLRNCSIGPELALDAPFQRVPGVATIERRGEVIWRKDVCTGEEEMCHSLANIEHHHFKFEGHRRPGDVHVHFFGAFALSFGDGVRLQDGDRATVAFAGLGRPLQNLIRQEAPRGKVFAPRSFWKERPEAGSQASP